METNQIQNKHLTNAALRNRNDIILLQPKLRDSVFYKVKELYSRRHIDEYIELAGLRANEKRLILEKLSFLQEAIYALDFYGENNWLINNKILDVLWKDIYQRLKTWNLDTQTALFLVKDMQSYQKIEIKLRYGILPLQIPVYRFYYLKTCDIRISRYLITSLLSREGKHKTLTSFWNYYDLLNEVYDDLLDLTEDLTTYNCNRFLIQLENQGVIKTTKEYKTLIFDLQSKIEYSLNTSDYAAEIPQLNKWFIETKEAVSNLLRYWEKNFIFLNK